MRYYTGIGSRQTPDDVLQFMVRLGEMFGELGLCLRSGAAPGADLAFEQGATNTRAPMEIILPWEGFAGSDGICNVTPEAYKIAEECYKFNWSRIKSTTKTFMARDCQQVTGINLDAPAEFVVCYTSDGCESHSTRTYKTGGTGQAISYADMLGIPVYNLANPNRDLLVLNLAQDILEEL